MRRLTLTALALTLVAVLTACQNPHPPGPTGKVTDRHKGTGSRYSLTVTGHKFRVTRSDYRHCYRGSHYPTCTHR
ncbi:hypothetical protein KVH31_34725 [Streptomyces olivaceus]|uniref:hypothetical protein n=1 Tax=Streptomyces olivaceus TaxID=47716 RepID=UPI001CCDC5BA|nr:hypothetical protein [Streptomyces olivaceus]MBZ6211653.1 hypothetical protein [Streptomyces olivaceus]